ncbi:methylenetetrahydrofolate reductase C-terminal domain-containing protein [Metapseudomonas otitidis]|uniref:Methylenetetrahydrofolate reductase n=1 Tax=Metapseudomonas otitidis TaxID=319939 RepID=A0A679G825_9GAMM|nr:methylenetetrahydrofolate reductase C-terminal domain-containing protein [Pseudomonas otitidis]BCA26901.1 methylenetetrahydrofolate reductase [Pseudomonas otitidis]
MSLLREALHTGSFLCIVEFVPKPDTARFAAFAQLMARGHLCGWPLCAAMADRVAGPADVPPAEAVTRLPGTVPALLHFSGKDRERRDLLAQLETMTAQGLDQLLLLSGDRAARHAPGQREVRYLESVPALEIVRQARPDWLLGAALNPFKYREEEGGAQYFKAEKKLAAGADFLTLQLGFDARKHQEAQQWMQRQAHPVPLLACVMGLTGNRAALLERVPGVVITPSMRAVLAAEAAISPAYADARSLDRLALQILGLKLMGYAGIHLSGVHTVEQLVALEQAIAARQEQFHDLEQWWNAWDASWHVEGAPPVVFSPEDADWRLGESRVTASPREQLRYHLLAALHHLLFSRDTLISRAFGRLLGGRLWRTSWGARWLHRLERSLKRPVVGCDTCGTCRLEATLYICPETCPKGLANGPCGGTRLNRCEFGDRECIHSIKYRTAKAVGQTRVLSDRLIPCVALETRHQSSWPRWFDARTERPAPPAAAPVPREH